MAKRIGVNLIIGVPTYELLPYTQEKVKSYNIRLAIHNHGPEDKLYPSPKIVYDLIKNRDESVRTLVLTNPHSTPMYRVNGTVSNIPAFYDAFHVKPTDPMYRPDSIRVKVW